MAKIPLCRALIQKLPHKIEELARSEVPGSHPGLALDRYLPFDVVDNEWKFDSEKKRPFLLEFARSANEFYRSPDSPWRLWADRQEEMLEDWKSRGINTCSIPLAPRWRWIIGLGNKTALETGMTLHHIYGIPYIPGTALKGLTQAYVELEGDSAQKAMLPCIFGQGSDNRKASAGAIVFLDALPIQTKENAPVLGVDIMTPHFTRYYRGETQYPLEEENPTPIPFLVVNRGDYRIDIAARTSSIPAEVVETAASLCQEALDNLGIGGKTAKGYGYFW